MSRLKDLYKAEVVDSLKKEFGYQNVMQVPKVTKVTLNMGVGEALGDKKLIENAVSDMQLISGQNRRSPKHVNLLRASRFVKVILSAVK